MFNINLTKARNDLALAREVHESKGTDRSRAFLLTAIALRLKELFTANTDMSFFQLTLVFKVEDEKEGPDRCVRVRQHLKIVAPQCPQLQDKDAKVSLWTQDVPYWAMGAGSWTVQRSDPKLQALLQTEANSQDEQVAAFALALDMNDAFEAVRMDHYLGEVL